MRNVAVIIAAFASATMGLVAACVAMDPPNPQYSGSALPDIGTKMPDGRVYAGLSMGNGKPLFVEAAGGKMADGTVFAGMSPDTGKRLYTTPVDAPGVYKWDQAIDVLQGAESFRS